MKVVAFAVLALAAGAGGAGLAGCSPAANSPDRQAVAEKSAAGTSAPEATASAASVPAPIATATADRLDLSAYVGKYPFDLVDGHRFLDNPAVKAAIAAAVPDAKERAAVKFEEGGLGIPIKTVAGGRILAWGGANHAEDRYNWSLVIAPDGSKPEVCIYDGLGYDDDTPSSQWFEPGRPSVMKQGKCPSDAEGYPARDVVAG